MNAWEQEFSKKMEGLREQSFVCFDRFAADVLDPTFESVASFVAQWKFRTSGVQSGEGRRSFKLSLTEDAYVLVAIRLEGIDQLECRYECSTPGQGRVAGVATSTSLRAADTDWSRSCFQMALDDLIGKLTEAERKEEAIAV